MEDILSSFCLANLSFAYQAGHTHCVILTWQNLLRNSSFHRISPWISTYNVSMYKIHILILQRCLFLKSVKSSPCSRNSICIHVGWAVLQGDPKPITQGIRDLSYSCCGILHFAVVNKANRTLQSTEVHPHRTACETGAWAQTIAVFLASLKDLLVGRLRQPTLLLLHCRRSVSEKSINQTCNTIIFPNWGLRSVISTSLNTTLHKYYATTLENCWVEKFE